VVLKTEHYVSEPAPQGGKSSNVVLIKANGEKEIVERAEVATRDQAPTRRCSTWIIRARTGSIRTDPVDGKLADKQRYYWLHEPTTPTTPARTACA